MTPIRRYSPVEWGALIAAATVMLFGATMAIAWLSGNVGLLQFVQTGPALRFNTALLFVLSGAALLASVARRRRWATSLAAAVVIFAAAHVLDLITGVDAGLETLLFRPSESLIHRVGNGHVAIGAAWCFVFLGGAILAGALKRYAVAVAALLGTVVCMLAVTAINRYAMGIDFRVGWPITSGMALTTAYGLFTLGAAVVALAYRQAISAESSSWLAYPLAFALAGASFMTWCELVDTETVQLQRATDAAVAGVRLQVREQLQARLKAVKRLAQRWHSLDSSHQRKDAQRIIEDFGGILAINWITNDRRVDWVCSVENRQDLLGQTLPPGPRHVAFQQARDAHKLVFTPVLELLHGEAGFIGYVPTLDDSGEIDGCIAAVFRVEMFLDAIAADRRHVGFAFSVEEGDRVLFANSNQRAAAPVVGTADLALHGLNWRFHVWPTPATVASHYTHAPHLALVKGLLSASLLGLAIHLRQRAVLGVAEAERSAAACRDSEQRFDLAVRASRDGIWEWRPWEPVFYVSSRYRELVDYPHDVEELSVEQWLSRVHPEDFPRLERTAQDHLQRLGPFDAVVRFQTFRDEWIWIRIRGQAAWDPAGQPIRIAGSITDITEQLEAERQILQCIDMLGESNRAFAEMAEAAEAAAQAKATFLRNMSHELRTPLNSIIGFSTGLLRRVAAHNLDSHQRDRIERIAASGRHLLGLVNNVLDIAKAEASDQAHQPEAFELPALLDEVTAMTESLLQKKPAVKLAVQIAGDAPVPVLDRAKLKQILLNLLSNAAKFTDQGAITLSVDFTSDGWRFAVADTGIGISADDQLRVFENFEQVRSPGRNVEGTGLGLSICAALAHAMGGQIALISRLGAGSTFTLLVPQSDESNALRTDDDALTAAIAPSEFVPLST